MGYISSSSVGSDPDVSVLELLNQADLALRHRHGAIEDTRVRILREVEAAGRRGLPQAALVKALNLSPATVSKAVDGLERAGMVEREFHTHDRRQRTLRLSDKGQTQRQMCDGSLQHAEAGLVGDLSVDDLATLKSLLDRLGQTARRLPCPGECAACALGGC